MDLLYNIIRLDNGGSYLIADILFFGLVILLIYLQTFKNSFFSITFYKKSKF